MDDKPTVFLSNWGSWQTPGQHGPGRRLCAMVDPRNHELGAGTVPSLHPAAHDLHEVQAGRMPHREYIVRFHVRLARALHGGELGPGQLVILDSWSLHHNLRVVPVDPVVRDGDTLLCACPRRGSSRWERPCHLEAAALYLARAGWDVVLYGRRLEPEPTRIASLGPVRVHYTDTGAMFFGGV